MPESTPRLLIRPIIGWSDLCGDPRRQIDKCDKNMDWPARRFSCTDH